MSDRFQHFAAIDWSGAAGERHWGIAVALASAEGGAPEIVWRGLPWSRQDILDWLLSDMPPDTLVGLDLGISLPFADSGAFFPGWPASPPDARSLWRFVDEICVADPNLSVDSFVEHEVASRYFRRHGGLEGASFHHPAVAHKRGRFRQTEHAQAELKGCKPYSNFNLVGAAQVGKSSLTGMRVLHRLQGRIPVWPIDKLPPQGSVIVEIYTTIAAIDAGRAASKSKMRAFEELNCALGELNCPTVPGAGPLDDHSADALLTAAWLRANAHRPELWHPEGLEAVRHTEGWTFGVA